MGFSIGPGAKSDSWKDALAKFAARVKQWESTKCGLYTLYYNTFVLPTLEFIAQLEHVNESVIEIEMCALRKLASGPCSCILRTTLNISDGIGNGFRMISHTAQIAKLVLKCELIADARRSKFWLRMQITSAGR